MTDYFCNNCKDVQPFCSECDEPMPFIMNELPSGLTTVHNERSLEEVSLDFDGTCAKSSVHNERLIIAQSLLEQEIEEEDNIFNLKNAAQ